jgi:hypothetical protein
VWPFYPAEPGYFASVRGRDLRIFGIEQETAGALLDTLRGRPKCVNLSSECSGYEKSGLALLLVAIGVYGTLSYTVTQRTGEIGIRLALGAAKVRIVWMILQESLIVTALGLAAGLPVTLTSWRLAVGTLFGVSPHDGVSAGARYR